MKANKYGGKTMTQKGGYKGYSKGGKSSARKSINYAVHRPEDGKEQPEHREIFAAEGELQKVEALDRLDRFNDEVASQKEGAESKVYHFALNPGEGRTEVDLQEYTRDVMQRIAERHADEGHRMDWVAVTHKNQSDHDHVHVIVTTDRTFSPGEFKHMSSAEVTGNTWKEAERRAEQARDLEQDRRIPAEQGREQGQAQRQEVSQNATRRNDHEQGR